MAAVAPGGGASTTTNASTYATASFTPAAGDLLIAIAGVQDTIDAGAYTSSDAGKTYTEIAHARWTANTDTLYAYVGDQAADADSQTGTMDVTGDVGGGCAQEVLRVSGMAAFGAAAIRQSKIVENAAAVTPTVTFDSACLAGNPTIVAVCANSAAGAPTAPDGWAQMSSRSFSTPNTVLTVWARDRGFTGTTITAGSSTSAHAIIAIELDAPPSSAGTMAATESGADSAAATGAVVVAGTAAATETGADTFAGGGTVEGAEPSPEVAPLTYGAGRLDPRRVQDKYDEIEAVERRIKDREAAERERIRQIEESKRQLAELEAKRRQTRTIAERRRKLEARIAREQVDLAVVREAIDTLLAEIERLRTEIEIQMTIADRRRRLLLVAATAA